MRILTFLKKNKIDLFSQKSAVSVFQTHKIENTFFREASSSILKKWIKYDEMEESRRNMKFFRKLFGSLTSLKIWNKKKCLLACLWAHNRKTTAGSLNCSHGNVSFPLNSPFQVNFLCDVTGDMICNICCKSSENSIRVSRAPLSRWPDAHWSSSSPFTSFFRLFSSIFGNSL